MKKKITSYEVVDHGVEHSRYFQGCEVSYTEYTFCVTGSGNSEREALDDCLDQLASMGYAIPRGLAADANAASTVDVVADVIKSQMPDTTYTTQFIAHNGLTHPPQAWDSLADARSACADRLWYMRRRGAIVTKLSTYKWEIETKSNREGRAVTDNDGVLRLDIDEPEMDADTELYYHVSVRVKEQDNE